MRNFYPSPVILRNVVPMFRTNFSGEMWGDGRRSFTVALTPEQADTLLKSNWAVKTSKPNPNDPQDQPIPYLTVNIRYLTQKELAEAAVNGYERKNPVIKGINEANVIVDYVEDTVSALDSARVMSMDIIIKPYHSSRSKPNDPYTAYLSEAKILYTKPETVSLFDDGDCPFPV